VVQGSLSREFVCGSGHLQRARQRSFRDRVRCLMGVLGVGIALLVPLIEDNVVSFVDPGALDAQLPQCANDHLGVLVACEVAAGTCNAPIEVSLIVEDCASPRAAPHEVYRANARGLAVFRAVCGIENAQIDLRPRVLVAPDDDAGPVDVEEEDRAVCGALSEDVVFDREVEIRVAAAGDVALQFVCGVGEPLRKRRVVPAAAMGSSCSSMASSEAAKGV
jgi:hypothetical protein